MQPVLSPPHDEASDTHCAASMLSPLPLMIKPAILTVQPLCSHPCPHEATNTHCAACGSHPCPHDEASDTHCAAAMLSPPPPHNEASDTHCAASMLSPPPPHDEAMILTVQSLCFQPCSP